MMRKIIGIILGIIAVLVIIACGAKFVTQNSSSQVAAIVDKANPLVGEDKLYVKTTKPDSMNNGTPIYQQEGVDRYGRSRPIQFVGMKVLRQRRYLVIHHKGAFVSSYHLVTAAQVPAAARAELR